MSAAEFKPEVITVTNLGKKYANGVQGLNGLNLSIYKGEIVGVLGTSGSGKTTFFRLLNGSLSATTGEISVLGERVNGLSYKALLKLRARIGLVHQHHNIIPGLTVAQNVLMGRLGKIPLLTALRMLFLQKESELRQVYEILDALGMPEKLFHRATDLSGGQQQRVAIARALLSDAEIILADEPVASVDASTAGVILSLFKKINQEKQTTIIMNLHQKDMALAYCSRVVVLDKGRLIYNGPPEGWIDEGVKSLGIERGA